MLKAIREFLAASGAADAASIARHIKADLSAVEGMLAFLEQHGQVKRCEMTCARRCAGCASASTCTPSKATEQPVLWALAF